MRNLLAAAFALSLVAVCPAFAQSVAGGGCPVGASSCTVTTPDGVTRTLSVHLGGDTVTLGASGVAVQEQYTLNVGVPNANSQGVQVAKDTLCQLTGAGTVTGGGHVPCIQVEAYTALSATQQLVPIESVVGTRGTGGTLSFGENFLAKADFATSATVSNWWGLSNLTNNAVGGTIAFAALVDCQAWTGTAPVANHCVFNSDAAQDIYSEGGFLTPIGQLGPAGPEGAATGRFYYGMTPGTPSGTVTINNTAKIWWTPFHNSYANAYRFIGIHVSAAGAGGSTCQLGVYSTWANQPWATQYITPVAVSAAATGDVTAAITLTNGGVLLPGDYWLGVWCTDATVQLAAYPEQSAQKATASATIGDSSWALTTNGGGSWAAGNTLTPTYGAGNSLPIIAFQR